MEEKKPTQRKRKVEKLGSSPTNNDTSSNTRMSVQMKERVESEQTEHEGRQKERCITHINEGVQRHVHPEEEQLIDYSCILQSQQMGLNRIPASNSQKNEKSHSSWEQRIQPQLFQVGTGQPEVHKYTTVYKMGDKR